MYKEKTNLLISPCFQAVETMFQLAEIRHMVRIPPWLFGQTLNDAVIEELNRKLANKVCHFVSLLTLVVHDDGMKRNLLGIFSKRVTN